MLEVTKVSTVRGNKTQISSEEIKFYTLKISIHGLVHMDHNLMPLDKCIQNRLRRASTCWLCRYVTALIRR